MRARRAIRCSEGPAQALVSQDWAVIASSNHELQTILAKDVQQPACRGAWIYLNDEALFALQIFKHCNNGANKFVSRNFLNFVAPFYFAHVYIIHKTFLDIEPKTCL